MKTKNAFLRVSLGLLFLVSGVPQLLADITVRISVKYILMPDGTRPAAGNIGTAAGFDAEIIRGNQTLAATGRGYQLQIVEYLDIRPPVPGGQTSDYWFNLNARANRQTIEDAATANAASMTTWLWNANAINIYVNNSSSGQCSFVGTGFSISLGNNIGTGTVLHELGHFFDLRHTHTGDNNGTISDWGDGDGLTETLPDDPDASASEINARYPAETQRKRDDLIFNVMSYHNEDRLLPVQMDIWAQNANGARLGFCTGRTWFIDPRGNCVIRQGGPVCTGLEGPFNTFLEGINAANPSGGDIVMIRPSSYNERLIIIKPVTLRATQEGPVTIGQ